MRGYFRRMIVASICSALLSVAALASPISLSSYLLTVPVTITELDRTDSAMTYNDFVATTPYVVVLDTATHVPIKQQSLSLIETRNYDANFAKVQNANFERTSSLA